MRPTCSLGNTYLGIPRDRIHALSKAFNEISPVGLRSPCSSVTRDNEFFFCISYLPFSDGGLIRWFHSLALLPITPTRNILYTLC